MSVNVTKPGSAMPKLIVKQDLPAPSFQDKLVNLLRSVLPAALILTLVATAWSFYLATRPSSNLSGFGSLPAKTAPAEQAGVENEKPQEEKAAQGAPASAALPDPAGKAGDEGLKAAEALPEGVELPPGFCPLFGPEAGSCKPGDAEGVPATQ